MLAVVALCAAVVFTAKITAQHGVTRFALVLHDADDLFDGDAHEHQRMHGQQQRAFNGLGHDFGSARLLQHIQGAVVRGAHHHGQIGAQGAHGGQHFQGAGGF